MIRYAATTDDGKRAQSEAREQIDRWAARECAIGHGVEVFARESISGPGSRGELVGRWEPDGRTG